MIVMAEEIKQKLNVKLRRRDIIAIAALVIFVVVMAIPVYTPKGDCQIFRAGEKCASAKDVMIENCQYWGKYSCDSTKDVSLPQAEWYISNLCGFQQEEDKTLDCSNLKTACNQVVGTQVCSG